MSQCLRCRKPCEPKSVFCNDCWLILRHKLQHHKWQESEISNVSYAQERGYLRQAEMMASVAPPEERIQQSSQGQPPLTPLPPALPPPDSPFPDQPIPLTPLTTGEPFQPDPSQQAVQKLNSAAQHIESGDKGSPGKRPRRLSRLSRVHDVSAEIQRANTPVPQSFNKTTDVEPEAEHDLGPKLPDYWPWLQSENAEDGEPDEGDFLSLRRAPSSAEAARIEAEDIRRAMLENATQSTKVPTFRWTRKIQKEMRTHRIRTIFAVVALIAVLAGLADTIIVATALLNSKGKITQHSGPPTLSLSTSTARVGQNVSLHIQHFSASSGIHLTRDVQDPLYAPTGQMIDNLKADDAGSITLTFQIDQNWSPGFHTLVAEDTRSRYTASSMIQIIGSGPTKPSHFNVDGNGINMGEDLVGSDTLQTLPLHNSGSGTVSWTATSDQPWLFLGPTAGMFSSSQNITVGVSRNNLAPGDYNGKITFTSSSGTTSDVPVQMSVRALPQNPGPVLAITPPVLSFNSVDGGGDPSEQALTINNPGDQPLKWSLTNIAPVQDPQSATDTRNNWLSLKQTGGTVNPGSSMVVQAHVNNRSMLAGTYTEMLSFASQQSSLNNIQHIAAALTVQPSCTLTTGAASLNFTSVAGHSNPSSQTVSLGTSANCNSPINWQASSNSDWLSVTPANGLVQGSGHASTSIWANINNLKPGTYMGVITFVSPKSTQTLPAMLTVQAPPAPNEPLMTAAPLALNFSTTAGAPSPTSQTVTITNSGGGELRWHTTANLMANTWINAAPTGGVIESGQSGQVTIIIDSTNLQQGIYPAQVIITGTDKNDKPAAGSQQTILVNLTVLPPCTLSPPSSNQVAFSATQGTGNPGPKTVTLTTTGNCRPLNWTANSGRGGNWLSITPNSGALTVPGQTISLTLNPSIANLAPTDYSTSVFIVATDDTGAQTRQSLRVNLAVLAPCALQIDSTPLLFTVPQGGAAPMGQTLAISETGSCSQPVHWTAKANNPWVQLSAGSGTDSGGGSSVGVNINPSGMTPKTYSDQITITAAGTDGNIIQGSPVSVSITLAVTGFTLSGTVIGCGDTLCATSVALPSATVQLQDSAGTAVASVVADKAGNYNFNNLQLGNYTLVTKGTNTLGVGYSGTSPVNLTGNISSLVTKAFHP